jgi:S1-C subfamily serine protease
VYGFFPALRHAEAPAPLVAAAPEEADDAAARLERLRAGNKGLEDEVLRLKALLREDPCALPALLGKGVREGSSATSPSPDPPATPSDPSATPSSPGPAPAGGSKDVPAPPGAALPPAVPAGIAELLTGATVFVVSSYDGSVGLGSGFFVAPGIVATNRHVARSPQARILAGNKALGGMHRADVVAFSADEDRDFALLKIDGGGTATVPFLRIAGGAERTERVSAWGFPGYIAAIDPKLSAMAEGDIKSVPDVVYSEGVVSVVLDRVPPVILHTAALSQGNSGGPLVNAAGVAVGINTFIRRADQSYSQTNIALPGSELAAFMRAGGFTPTGPE